MLLLFVLLWPLYSLSSTPIFLGIVVAAFALVDSIASILTASYRLAAVPDDLQGRVGSVYRLILFGSLTLGQALIGISLERLGVPITIGILWGGLILLAATTFIHPSIHPPYFLSLSAIAANVKTSASEHESFTYSLTGFEPIEKKMREAL